MKKVFRLANAEFNKIFNRPSIFILTAFLIILLVLTFFIYKPVATSTKLSYTANTVGGIYTEFVGTKNTVNKSTIDKSFEDVYNRTKLEFDSITKDDKLKSFTDKTTSLYVYLNETLLSEQTRIYGPSGGNSLNSSQRNQLVSIFKALKQKASELLSYMAEIKGTTLNFYFTYSNYDAIYNEIQKLYDACPNNYDVYKTKEDFSHLSNTLRTNFNLQKSRDIIANLKKLSIDFDVYDKLVKTYYTDAKAKLNDYYMVNIDKFYNENFDSKDENKLNDINNLISQYYSYTKMNMSVLENKFMLLRINDKSDTELKDLIGYTEVSKYDLNEQNQINDYLLKNNTFDYEYLRSFNFNTASGSVSNVYDYTVYTMQILSLLITIFTVFYACSSIAGDQSNGTMKMIAIRPYTRNKLFTGKYLSCVIFGVMLMLISLIASFVVGAIMYGVPLTSCLVVFNSSTILTINPLLLLLLYFLSLVVNLLFYISLAMFICLIFKSNTLSVFIATLVYAAQVVLCGLVQSAWLKYTPFGHFDLFKYFGNSKAGMFCMNILPDANFIVSALVIGLMIVVLNSLSHLIFKTRDIA